MRALSRSGLVVMLLSLVFICFVETAFSLYLEGKMKVGIQERLAEEYPDVDLLFMTEKEYDVAIVGVSVMCLGTSNHHQVIYDWDLIIQANIDMGMTELEAIEFFDYNQGGAYVGEHTPIYIRNRSNIIGER